MHCLIDGVGDYFGITMCPDRRLTEHLRLRRGSKLRAAVELFREDNFVFEIVDKFSTEKAARAAESASIIKHKTGWPDGLNVKGSGRRTSYVVQGVTDPLAQFRKAQISLWDAERKKRIDAERALRKILGMTEFDVRSANGHLKKIDDAWREKQRVGATGRINSEETKEKKRQATKRMWADPEKKEKLASRRVRAMPSKEEVASLRQANIAAWENPETKAARKLAMKKAWSGPKGDARRQALRERWSDPEFKAKNTAAMKKSVLTEVTPEMRAAMSAGQRRRWERARLLDAPEGSA